ncbi:MAG TPA: putative toxin-antitoxin system toxin component, PIN family [Coleofasciculaceae cyanobacterium]|jgi:putative PIN family toxin of toxin-antitoxin system
MNPEPVVVDTNVLISAALSPNRIPRKTINLIANGNFVIIQSEATYQELTTRIQKKKFDKYISNVDRKIFLTVVEKNSKFISVSHQTTICIDADDNKFLELAVSGMARYVVTGDNDLLCLQSYQDINIITAADFLNLSQRQA